MEVLKNNYQPYKEENLKKNNPYPRELTCEKCGSELKYDESDVKVGALGLAYVTCPCCEFNNMIEDNEKTIDLTKDNVEFPSHFFYTSKENCTSDCCNHEHVNNAIKSAINYFRKNKDEFAWMTEFGNLHVTVFRYDDDIEYYVIVTDNYYSTYIPFEYDDY